MLETFNERPVENNFRRPEANAGGGRFFQGEGVRLG